MKDLETNTCHFERSPAESRNLDCACVRSLGSARDDSRADRDDSRADRDENSWNATAGRVRGGCRDGNL